MAKVKPEGDTGFVLVRLRKGNSRQTGQVRENITEELGVSWVRQGFSTCEGVMRVKAGEVGGGRWSITWYEGT